MASAVGPRSKRTNRLLVLGAFIVVAALVAGTANATRSNQDDPRNQNFGLTYNGNPTQDCWKHHKSEGMTDSHFVIPIFPKAIKTGEPAKLRLQVENAWKYDIAEIKVQLNLSGSENHIMPLVGSAAEATPPFNGAWYGTLGNEAGKVTAPLPTRPLQSSWQNITVDVQPGAAAMIADLKLYYAQGAGTGLQNRVDVFFYQPDHSRPAPWEEGGNDPLLKEHSMTLPRGKGLDATAVTPGKWVFQLHFFNGDAPTVDYAMTLKVFYASVGQETFNVYEQLRNPPDKSTPGKPVSLIKPRGVSDVIEIPILGVSEGTQRVQVKVTALLYYKHQAGGTPNEDSFERWASQDIVVGDRLVESDVATATGGAVTVDFYLMAGEVTGFAAAFLLLPSLLLGGTYGKSTRKFLNDVLGGAKRRVMFHNLVSLGLTLVALVHIVFFLLEVRYTVMMGVLWGGLGALSLLILGLTGYYQVPLIQKYGYNWWRTLHLLFGVLVVVFVAWHSIQDGPDFFEPVKQHMPQWIQDVNWARAKDLK